jgi:hypothetical protein
MKERYEGLPPWGRIIALGLLLVVAGSALVLILALVFGWMTNYDLSNAFFFAAAALFIAAMVVYWGRGSGAPAESEQEDRPPEPGRGDLPRRFRKRRSLAFPPLSLALFLAGILLFGLSVLVGMGIS